MEAISSLESEIEQLKFESGQKDSMINQALRFYKKRLKRIYKNIDVRQGALRANSENSENVFQEKDWIIQEVEQNSTFYRMSRIKKKHCRSEKKDLKNSGLEMAELQNLVRKLVEDIEVRDEQLLVLRQELDNTNKELGKAF